jgi:arsenate reductase
LSQSFRADACGKTVVAEQTDMKNKVLFVCIHNSARSQMAEAFLNRICPEDFTAQSAGLEPGNLNPLAVKVMGEIGIDISHKKTQSVSDVIRSGAKFAHVITVCDETSAERCPIVPGGGTRIHWSFADPSTANGTPEEKLVKVRAIRDEIKSKIESWCEQVCQPKSLVVGGN